MVIAGAALSREGPPRSTCAYSRSMKIFGREPALVIAVIGSLGTLLAGLNLNGLSAGAASAAVALLTAVIIAFTTRPVAPALFTGVVAAAASLLAEYSFHVSETTVSSIGAVIITVFAFFGVRPQVTPVTAPAPRSTFR